MYSCYFALVYPLVLHASKSLIHRNWPSSQSGKELKPNRKWGHGKVRTGFFETTIAWTCLKWWWDGRENLKTCDSIILCLRRVYNNLSKSSETLIVDSFANNEARVAAEIKLQLVDETVKVCIYPHSNRTIHPYTLLPSTHHCLITAPANPSCAIVAMMIHIWMIPYKGSYMIVWWPDGHLAGGRSHGRRQALPDRVGCLGGGQGRAWCSHGRIVCRVRAQPRFWVSLSRIRNQQVHDDRNNNDISASDVKCKCACIHILGIPTIPTRRNFWNSAAQIFRWISSSSLPWPHELLATPFERKTQRHIH